MSQESPFADAAAARATLAKFLSNTTTLFVFGEPSIISEIGPACIDRERPLDVIIDHQKIERGLRPRLEGADLRTTRFVASSLMGGDPDLLERLAAAKAALEKAGGGKYLKHHFLIVTLPGDNVLHAFAASVDCPVVELAGP